MGRRGRHPDPNSKRSQAALARAAALGKATPAPPPKTANATTSRPPADVSAVPAAAEFWREHAAILTAAGRLRPEHVRAFSQLCHLFADTVELRELVASEGRVIATGKGQGISPVARLLREARADFLTGCREFGLTPAAETRFPPEVAANGEEDDADARALRAFIA